MEKDNKLIILYLIVFFFNSGASSLLFFLNLFGTKKRVGLQVFTCSTVLDVIQMAEDRVVLMDIDKDYFTTTYDIVEKHIDSIDILILSLVSTKKS